MESQGSRIAKMTVSRYWPVLLIVTLFFITSVQTNDEFDNANADSDDSEFMLPKELPYKTTVDHKDQKYMTGWYKMVNGFISAIHSKSSETVEIIMGYIFNKREFVVPKSIFELLKLQYAIIACVVFGLTYIIVMWITGLIFFCCRCCGNCGGKRVQVETSRTSLWRKLLILFLIVLIILLLIAVIFMFTTSKTLSTSYSTSEKTIKNIFEDVESFITNTENQIQYIAFSCLNETIKRISNLFKNLENFLTEEITEGMKDVQKLMSFANDSITGALKLSIVLNTTNSNVDDLNQFYENIINNLKDIQTELENLKKNCDSEDCKKLNPNIFNVSDNFDNEFIGKVVNSFSELNFEDYKNSQKNISDTIKNLPKEINEQTKPYQKEIISGLEKLSKEAQNSVNKETNKIIPKVKNKISIIRNETKNYNKQAKKIENYRKYIYLAICIIMTFIVFCLVIGLFFGICGYQSNRQATKRTSMSNAGGYFLLISVAWMFSFSGLFMLLTMVLFLIGSSTEIYICQPLYDDKLIMINKIMENILNNTNLTSEMSFIAEISPEKILSKCRSNETVFKIFDLEKQLSEKFDYRKKLNLDEQMKKFNKIDLPEIKILNNEVESFISNLEENLKFEDIKKGIENFNQDIILNVEEQKQILEKINNSESSLKDEIIHIMTNISNVEKLKEKFSIQKNKLIKTLNKTVHDGKRLVIIISHIHDNMKDLDKNLTDILKQATKEITEKFALKLQNHGDKLINFIIKSLNERIVPCKPIWNIFDSIRTLLCKCYFQGLNGFWFALGWCLFCFIPSIIVATKLSKHFLRMKNVKRNDKEGKHDYDMELAQRNKIRPDNGWQPPVHHM